MGSKKNTIAVATSSIATIFGLAAVYFFSLALSCLSYSQDDRDTAEICEIPEEVLYPYLFIGRANRNGLGVKQIWLRINYYGESRDNVLSNTFSDWRRDYLQAEAAGFNLHPTNPNHPDHDVMIQIRNLKRDCPEAVRRADSSVRWNDFLRQLGVTTLFAIGFWFLRKIGVKSEKSS